MSRTLGTDSHPQTLADLAKAKGSVPNVVTRTTGTIVSVQVGPPKSVTITVAGDATNVPDIRYRRSYTPVVGDVVDIDVVGTVLTVVGALA